MQDGLIQYTLPVSIHYNLNFLLFTRGVAHVLITIGNLLTPNVAHYLTSENEARVLMLGRELMAF